MFTDYLLFILAIYLFIRIGSLAYFLVRQLSLSTSSWVLTQTVFNIPYSQAIEFCLNLSRWTIPGLHSVTHLKHMCSTYNMSWILSHPFLIADTDLSRLMVSSYPYFLLCFVLYCIFQVYKHIYLFLASWI